MARAFEAKLKTERFRPDLALSQAYRKYWNTPETEPMATFVSLHREIDILERQVGVEGAWRTLEESARNWYQEKGTCPFCGKDELHLSGRG